MALTNDQLSLLDGAKEVNIETRSDHGSVRTIIWIVVIEETVYVRSVRGETGRWYERALADPQVSILADGQKIDFRAEHVIDPDEIEAVTHALRDKYPPGGSLDRMTREEVLDTTLRLEPISSQSSRS